MTDTPTPEALALIEELRRHGVVISIGRVTLVALALDRFAAARVEAERERCEHSDRPPRTPAIGQGGRVAPTEAARRNDNDAAIRRAREQSERMKR